MINKLLFSFCLLYSSLVLSQEPTTRLQFMGGTALPMGDFASKTFSQKSGFANSGRSLGVKFFIPITKTFDLNFGYSNNTFSVNRNSYISYNERIIKGTIDPALLTEEFSISATIENYTNNNVSLGVQLNLALDPTMNFYLNPQLTYSWFKIPDVGMIVSDSSYRFGLSQTSNPSRKLALSFSAGFNKNIASNLQAFVDFTYLKSDHKPEVRVSSINQSGESVETTEIRRGTFRAVTASIGLVIRLKAKE